MKNPEDFFSILERSVPELARAVIETQESKAMPKGTLLFEIEQKSKGFFISDVG